MSNKKVLILFTVLFSIFLASYYFLIDDDHFHTNESVDTQHANQFVPESTSKSPIISTPSSYTAESTKKPLNESVLQTNEHSLADSPELQAQQKAAAFFSSKAFLTDENINASYVNKDGSVSRNSIEMSFVNDDFNQLVMALENAERNSASFELESKLSGHLYNTLKSSIYDEKYSCAGNVCALTFKAAKSEDEFDLIKNFSSSYSFTNVTQDEQGLIVYKAVYIQTEDPSNLVIQ